MSLESSHIGDEILAYLYEHPDSSDTVEGITQWWLLECKIECQSAKVKKALNELVENEYVIEDKKRNSQIHYRLNQQKEREIQAILNQRPNDMDFVKQL